MAIALTKIYTRGGDSGTTSLIGGQRVSKAAPRIEAYGTVDELNAALGLARSWLDRLVSEKSPGDRRRSASEGPAPVAAGRDSANDGSASLDQPHIAVDSLRTLLKRLQNELFDLGCDLATPADQRHPERPVVTAGMIEQLEHQIDAYNESLPELKSFVLPGGGMAAGFLHLARTICRRAERIVVALGADEPLGEYALTYLNRLSDLLFVLSRVASRVEEHDEYLWEYRR
ncbi:MAG: cob(I)yrinic acid a,c-diamide adenosyltransferase [Myxococcales bacterium]|nr:cob(I)yrinic acid a,c-diamide adenosyltransferase [Myxococcales bacterium]